MVGRDVIDDHFVSVATLANMCSGNTAGTSKSGQRLITGSFSKHDVIARRGVARRVRRTRRMLGYDFDEGGY